MKDERKMMLFITSLILPFVLSSCIQTKQNAAPVINLTTVPSDICGEDHKILGDRPDLIETSSDNQWFLVNCESKLHDDKYARVFRLDGSASWKISLADFPWVEKDHPLRRLFSSNWSNDGKFVYLQPAVEFDPTNHGVFVTLYSLYRLDLQMGDFNVILSSKEKNLSPFSTEFSPDGKYLVYVDLVNRPNLVNILDLQTNKLRSIELDDKYIDTGAFVWTQDSKKLMFVAAFDGWENLKAGMSLYSLEIDTFSLETIIYDDPRLLFPHHNWVDENTLLLSEFLDGTLWKVNIQSGVLEPETKATPTPR